MKLIPAGLSDGVDRGARTFVELFVGNEFRIREQSVLEVVDADLGSFAITNRTQMTGNFQSALMRFFYGCAQFILPFLGLASTRANLLAMFALVLVTQGLLNHYGVKLVGEDHIALGSDFDGGPPLPREIHDISDYPEMTKAMERLGYSGKARKKRLSP